MPSIALFFHVYRDSLLTGTVRREWHISRKQGCHSGVGFAVVSDAAEAVEVQAYMHELASIKGTGMSKTLPPPPRTHFSSASSPFLQDSEFNSQYWL